MARCRKSAVPVIQQQAQDIAIPESTRIEFFLMRVFRRKWVFPG
jgi:hypothetical protein